MLNYKVASLYLVIIVIFCSCASEKKYTYFQKGSEPDSIKVAEAYVPRIQSGDILSIFVNSLSTDASVFFNPFVTGANNGAGAVPNSSSSTSIQGYLVDSQGNIQLPLLGTTHVIGLTTIDLMNLIKDKAKIYLKEPTVSVRFLNYKISVMGEVSKPSVYVIPNEMITLPEALAMAGDLNAFAKRSNILVVREVDGKKVFGRVDLNTRDVYSSPFYYLHNNDLVYVEPSKYRAQQNDRTVQYASFGLSLISFIIVLSRR